MGVIKLSEEASASTPPADMVAIYPKAGGDLYKKSDDGVEVLIGSINIYIGGAPDSDNTWRLHVSGNDLLVQRREGGTYVTKSMFTP